MDARVAEKLALREAGGVEVKTYESIGPGTPVYNPADLQARFRAKMAARGGVEMQPDPALISPTDRMIAALEAEVDRLNGELRQARAAAKAKGGDDKLRAEIDAAKAELEKVRKAADEAVASANTERDQAVALAAKATSELEQLTKPAGEQKAAPAADAAKQPGPKRG